MPQLLLLILLMYTTVGYAQNEIKFFYDMKVGGSLKCGDKTFDDKKVHPPYVCSFDSSGEMKLYLETWKGKSAVLKDDGSKDPRAGDCGGSLVPDANQEHAYGLNRDCLKYTPLPVPNYDVPKAATGKILIGGAKQEEKEWYTDLPWNQKLSTKDSNLFKAPFMLPYAALDKSLCQSTETEKDKSRCMLRYGVVNVMAMERIDTLYKADDLSDDQENCRGAGKSCVEVNIKIQRLHTGTNHKDGYEADVVTNDKIKYPATNDDGTPVLDNTGKQVTAEIPSLGFAITEATVFAPWRPWYTGHYCAKTVDHITDAVCYEDYFTTQLQALAAPANNEVWLRDNPAVMNPPGEKDGFKSYCKAGEKLCNMYIGKVNFIQGAQEPPISSCRADPLIDCKEEVLDKTSSLDDQFNEATDEYYDAGRYPWNAEPYFEMSQQSAELDLNPFVGFYELKKYQEDAGGDPKAPWFKATRYVLPNQCSKKIYQGAREGNPDDIEALAACALDFEVHTSGFFDQWRRLWPLENGKLSVKGRDEILKALKGLDANQYGRTNFLYAGVREQHLPVSFNMLDAGETRMSVHDKMYNASLYTQYLPMVNPADQNLFSKSYTDDFWHAFLMSNHMNQSPDHFIRGVRGRVLWHNEYRSDILYKSDTTEKKHAKGTAFENILGHVDFPAGFQFSKADKPLAPFHGNTCDSCHIRNGSGVPLMPNGELPAIHVARGMKTKFKIRKDYTYSNPEKLPAMKMVLLDLGDKSNQQGDSKEAGVCDDDNNSGLAYQQRYSNKIMNYYGNSLHVNQKGNLPTYSMKYVEINPNSDNDFEIAAAATTRGKYKPTRIEVSNINVGTNCKVDSKNAGKAVEGSWPDSCKDVDGQAILTAINKNEIGFIHLVGRRLGNTPMIEMVPNKIIKKNAQTTSKMKYPGCISKAPGTRIGMGGKFNYRSCSKPELGDEDDQCYIGRWGWIGDRASLEDQIANAAIVEMNMSSRQSYTAVKHDDSTPDAQLVRYKDKACGPANAACRDASIKTNSDITEEELRDMATYQRWIGIPNRSEYQVSSDRVKDGEETFRRLQCNNCHVIDKIPFVVDDNMLPDEERAELEKLQIKSNGSPDYPFISYLGTDLLLHDMGYLSQVAKAPKTAKGETIKIRDTATGLVNKGYDNYIQRIRTPALKGLRFNRFVTDSNHNTNKPIGVDVQLDNNNEIVSSTAKKDVISGCDFLLHDGRACDAIEAAFLHDGPAIKALGTIEGLHALPSNELEDLRAFLYSL